MENKKQTAVEWLVEQIEAHKIEIIYSDKIDSIKCLPSIVAQAKAMERDQIEQAHEDAFIRMNMSFRAAHRAEAYYDEVYGAQDNGKTEQLP
jgi:dTDP-4-amino-4,6-dideoxygalactose transaminase